MLFFYFQTHTIETPSSIYPGDMLPSFSDSSGKEKLFSDTITTPLSNNSIITMTMRNNHLIVKTEERIPISVSKINWYLSYVYMMQSINLLQFFPPSLQLII